MAHRTGVEIIGVNKSYLVTFETDINTSLELSTHFKDKPVYISESAIFRGQVALLPYYFLMGFWQELPYDGWQCGWKGQGAANWQMLKFVDCRQQKRRQLQLKQVLTTLALCSPKAASWVLTAHELKGVTGQTKIVGALVSPSLRELKKRLIRFPRYRSDLNFLMKPDLKISVPVIRELFTQVILWRIIFFDVLLLAVVRPWLATLADKQIEQDYFIAGGLTVDQCGRGHETFHPMRLMCPQVSRQMQWPKI